jgi:hypothetical protein
VLPTRVSLQLTAVVAVAVDIGDDEPVQAETEVEGVAQVYRVPEYASEPLISPNATPPVTYTRVQGVISVPKRARIEESDFCLTEPEKLSVRRKLLPVMEMGVADAWFNELSAFFQDQSPSMPNTQDPGPGPFPIIQR